MSVTPDTGPSLFEDLVAGLAALGGPTPPLQLTVEVAGERSSLQLPADGGQVLIGRSPDSGIVVAAPQASRIHAELRSTDGRLFCHDARSSYGTWVERDGARLSLPVELAVGDRIVTAGDVVLFSVVRL